MMTRRIPSSSSFTCPWTYSVFLNFRGIDTRTGFTGHLYKALCDKGIKTFIDDEELQKGEEITPALAKAIEVSRIAIVIFSQNYASSKFCLEELVKIIMLMWQMHLFVLPVFYRVGPADVRYQKGVFGEKFNMLIEKRFKTDIDKVQNWKSALKAASDLSGWHFNEGYDFEYKLIENIIDEVCRKTTRIPLHVANYPIGLESRVQEVNTLLQDGGNGGVNMVGIYGIGGIGKTTIACAVYNLIADHFEGVCFLNDIRENSITNHDKAQLQKKLLADILGEKDIKLGSVKEGITIIKHMLPKKKVLLILDDVDKLEQLQTLAGGLDWFGFGSNVIITTRNKYLLDAHHVDRKYKVVGLNDAEALKLFTWNAFKKEKIDPSFIDLSKDVISYSNGLPLALEVIGSNLCRRSRDVWESALREYQRIPHKSIYDVLKVSYDGLEEYQQKIFLDLACFFLGDPLEYVMHMFLYGRDLDPKYGIQELVDKSLVTIDQKNCVRMHDLIKDMGREIVRKESPSWPGKRSRLWSSADIIHILEANVGSETIEMMMVNLPQDRTVQWDGKAFKKMKNLQVLIIKSVDFSTTIKYLPTSLRVLEWMKYPFSALSSNILTRNLVSLNLSNGCFMLDGPLKKLYSLSHLNLSGNKVLTQVPDISGAPNLMVLRLNNCLNLSEIHNSVGIHSKLRVLDATRCTKLSNFPHCIMMKSLEFLCLSHCSSLKGFPEISGEMENLSNVKLDYSGIKELPWSVQNLVGLEDIELKGCNWLSRLPSSILTLPKLKNLFVPNCYKFYFYHKGEEKEQERVSSLVHSNERVICLNRCNLRSDFLPSRLPCLSDWKVLRLVSCHLMILPGSIKNFHFLERIELIRCYQLQEIRQLPPSLKKLKLFECTQVREITELPPNIKQVFAPNCTFLNSKSSSMLLSKKLHEVRAKFIVLPGVRVPKWFEHCSKGPSLSFWFRKKFPSMALCAIISTKWPPIENLNIVMIFNGAQRIKFHGILQNAPDLVQFEGDHIVVFDLETELTCHEVSGLIIKHGWNHVEISVIGRYSQEFAKWIGVYVYKQKTNMQDVSFTRPTDPPKRKFDDFDVQDNPYIKCLCAPLNRPDVVLPAWFYNNVTPFIWTAIWKMQAPPKVKILLWEICQHELPTCQSLFLKKIIYSPLCPICGEGDETIEHVFLLCPWTWPIWFGTEFQWIFDFNSCIEVWLWQRFQIIKRVHRNFHQANALLGCIFWAIWKARNNFVFEGQPVNPECTLSMARTMHKNFSYTLVQETILPRFSLAFEICGEATISSPSPNMALLVRIRKKYNHGNINTEVKQGQHRVESCNSYGQCPEATLLYC